MNSTVFIDPACEESKHKDHGVFGTAFAAQPTGTHVDRPPRKKHGQIATYMGNDENSQGLTSHPSAA